MTIARRVFLKLSPLQLWRAASLLAGESKSKAIYLGQGTMSADVTDSSALLQRRLTLAPKLDADGDLPGGVSVACFEWSTWEDFSEAKRAPFQPAADKHDFIVRAELNGLKPNTTHQYRVAYGATDETELFLDR